MDAGNFPTYEKIINTTPLPRTRQGGGFFLLEISFSPSEKTHSLSVPMHLEFGAFGDVCLMRIDGWTERHQQMAFAILEDALKQLQPPAHANLNTAANQLTIIFIENKPVREVNVQGTLVFSPDGALTALLAPLK